MLCLGFAAKTFAAFCSNLFAGFCSVGRGGTALLHQQADRGWWVHPVCWHLHHSSG
jgi:lipid-binding SYLF domain-containing protein